MARNDTFPYPRVWITGASSGIGRALAIELARRGALVAVSARNRAALKGLAAEYGSGHIYPFPMDATVLTENTCVADSIRAKFGGLDLAVFNAGTCEYVDAAAFDSALCERVMQTNFVGMMHGVEAALPLLRESRFPRLAGMSSAVAFGPLPRAEAYGASKVAIRYALGSLRISLRSSAIPVTVICPGFVRTPLTDRNDFPMPCLVEVDAAARRIADGLARGDREIHFPRRFTIPYRLLSLLPGALYDAAIARGVLAI